MKASLLIRKVKFDKNGLVPAIIQDVKTAQVLMVAYMNRLALKKTLETGKTHFFSRSHKKLWLKGESSGHIQKVRGLFLDCDGDAVLVKVAQNKAACHTGYYSCFYREMDIKKGQLKIKGKRIFDPKKIYK